MAIKLVLAPLTGGKRDTLTLAGAFAAAEPFQAHVRALFVRPNPTESLPYFGEGIAPAIAEEVVNVSREAIDASSDSARAAWNAAATAAEFETVEAAQPGPTSSFVEMNGHFADCIAQAGQLADLIVFGPLKEGGHPGLSEAFEAALLKTGSPVLLGSEALHTSFATIAIGWNGSPASAHAVSAALPFLAKAREVQIISVQSAAAETGVVPVQDYLRVHGIATRAILPEAQTGAVGDVLLETAVANRADLLVTGGYGHSRLREWFAGGVTRRILSQATLPLFLVH